MSAIDHVPPARDHRSGRSRGPASFLAAHRARRAQRDYEASVLVFASGLRSEFREACQGLGLCHYVSVAAGLTVRTPCVGEVRVEPPLSFTVEVMPGQEGSDFTKKAHRPRGRVMGALLPPQGVKLTEDIEHRPGAGNGGHRARVRWLDPTTRKRRSQSDSFATEAEARDWIERMKNYAAGGVDPATANQPLAAYGTANMRLVLRGLEPKTTDPYLAGWRKRVVPSLGHLAVRMITYGVVDRAVSEWIAEGASRSTVKNSLAMLVRVLEQAVRDGIIDRNPARITGWQTEFRRVEDELDDPRTLALRDWATLTRLAAALVERSSGHFVGWGHVVIFGGATAARIGEVSGCRAHGIDMDSWTWNVRRQTTPSPGGLADKATKGKRARLVPLIEEVRPMVAELVVRSSTTDGRLFVGPRGGRLTTAILRDATHWDEVVESIGLGYLRRHDLRHTGLTWMADAGVPVHHLRKIAGHGSLSTTQRYLHPSHDAVTDAGDLLTNYLRGSQRGPTLRAV